MTTIKSYTDIEQSKKLAEILPIDSADMYYFLDPTPAGNVYHLIVQRIDFGVKTKEPEYNKGDIPCWSLAALFDLIPSKIYDNNGNYAYLWVHKDIDKRQNKDNHYLAYHDPYDDFEHIETNQYDNFVDACYDMILKLYELKLI